MLKWRESIGINMFVLQSWIMKKRRRRRRRNPGSRACNGCQVTVGFPCVYLSQVSICEKANTPTEKKTKKQPNVLHEKNGEGRISNAHANHVNMLKKKKRLSSDGLLSTCLVFFDVVIIVFLLFAPDLSGTSRSDRLCLLSAWQAVAH